MNKNFNNTKYEMEFLKTIKPKLSFDKNNDFNCWRNSAKQKLVELLGLPLQKCDPLFEIEHKIERETHFEYRFTVQTEPNYFVPCYLLIPKTESKNIPLTICLSGHGSGMHISLGIAKNEKDEQTLKAWGHRAAAIRTIKEGRAALVIEARNFGETSKEGYGVSCEDAAHVALLSGRTVIGERVWDAMRILDAVLENFDVFDEKTIMCTGNSGGGTATYYLACLDERIAVAAPSCSVCTFDDSIGAMSHCICNYVPSVRKFFEMGDLAGLIAPRKLVVATGLKDAIFPIEGAKKAFATIQSIYDYLGFGDNCALVVGNDGHFFYADEIWEKIHKFGF